LRNRGEKYSIRLENQINSVNWAESLAVEQQCDFVVHLGDFFDASALNSEEITALKEIKWANLPHMLLVGNHEIGTRNLEFNSLNSLASMSQFSIIDSIVSIPFGDTEVVVIPYMFESDRPSIKDLFKTNKSKKIVFSHNDIKGIQMGKFVSKEGFDIDDISKNCSLFINGHLHNGEKIGNIINVGNLTGQNFGEDAFKYDHVALILDTADMRVAVFENPYALNFYKLDFVENDSIDYINQISALLKSNAVCTIRCKDVNLEYLKKRFGIVKDEIIPHCNKIIASRFVIVPDIKEKSDADSIEIISKVDHLQLFRDYVISNLGTDDVVISELQEVCK
jgi:DNA repair exonuclease SbcCD nuclease subunit